MGTLLDPTAGVYAMIYPAVYGVNSKDPYHGLSTWIVNKIHMVRRFQYFP